MSKTERPDIVLMDIGLPVTNAWEATRAIKADANTAAIPMIALTAHSMPGAIVRRRWKLAAATTPPSRST